MIRGTTAEFKFNLPYRKDELVWATIKFWQPRNTSPYLPITKKLEHCEAAGDSTELCVSLTAEETARFTDKLKARVQLRAQHNDGTVFGSREEIVTVYPINDEILEEDPMLPTEDEEGFVILDGGNIGGE